MKIHRRAQVRRGKARGEERRCDVPRGRESSENKRASVHKCDVAGAVGFVVVVTVVVPAVV